MGDDSFARSIPHRKEVLDAYKPNSFRVVTSEDDIRNNAYSNRPDKSSPSSRSTNILGQQVTTPLPYDPWAYGRPAPARSRLLHGNVKTMMHAVSDVITTDPERNESGRWWRHPGSSDLQPQKTFTLDTTFRNDFQKHSGVNGSGRHTSNPNTTPAIGGAPVTCLGNPDVRQRFVKEGISYEHQYDSRLDPNYPTRGKRQGNFVWEVIPTDKSDQFPSGSRFGHSKRLMPSRERTQKRSETMTSSGTHQSRLNCRANCCPKNAAYIMGQTPVAL